MKIKKYRLFFLFVLPVLSLIGSAIIIKLKIPEFTEAENTVISILIAIGVAIYTHSYSLAKMSDEHEETHLNIKVSKEQSLREISNINKAISQIEKLVKLEINSNNLHPYFVKQVRMKLEKSLDSIKDLLEGKNWTSPNNSLETFGAEGLRLTKDNGIIKATSAVPDYWLDPRSDNYLKANEEIIKTKNARIIRIFIYPKAKHTSMKSKMQIQKDMGIEVRYIHKESTYATKEYLEEDYLIQDDEILVQIFCSSHQNLDIQEKTELITTSKVEVEEMLNHFDHLYSQSKPL